MNLIGRYIFREAFGSWLMVMLVLFLIFMTNQLADILGDAAADRLPRDAVLAIFGLTALRYLTLLMPITLFLGVTLALARLNRDGEMAALSACGIGLTRLLVPIGAFTLLLAVGLTWLALVLTPAASRRIEEIRFQRGAERRAHGHRGGQVHVARLRRDRAVCARGRRRRAARRVPADAAGRPRDRDSRRARPPHRRSRDGGAVIRSLRRAPLRRRARRAASFSSSKFDEHGMPIRPEEEDEFVEAAAAKPTLDLVRSAALADRAELHWRLSLPLSLFVLALLAVPLSRTSPREGRYARLGMALFIYLIYTNLLSIARVWVERGVVSDTVGMWWVHAIVALLGLLLLARDGGWFVRAPAVRAVPA